MTTPEIPMPHPETTVRGAGEANGYVVPILYRNWRGEVAVRRIEPGRPHAQLWFGSTEWHPEPQWLISARDLDRDARRDFAVADILAWGQKAIDAAAPVPPIDQDGVLRVAREAADAKGLANLYEAMWQDSEKEVARWERQSGYTRDLIAEAFHEHRREHDKLGLPPWSEVQRDSGCWRHAFDFASRLSALADAAAETDDDTAVAAAVDWSDLNQLFAQMPTGPWHALRSESGHEIRQIDTDPTNKHHWPFRLCQSIAGQRAQCDDAVFDFLAGVLNVWPSIARLAATAHRPADPVPGGDAGDPDQMIAEPSLADQAKHHGRDWAVWWQGSTTGPSGERGDHIMEMCQSGIGYAREIAFVGAEHHEQAHVLVDAHNEQVRRLREVIGRQAAAKGLLQAELGRIKAVIPASLSYEVSDAAEAIATTFNEYVKVAAEATALRKQLDATRSDRGGTDAAGQAGGTDQGTEWFWRIVDGFGIDGIPSCEVEGLRMLCHRLVNAEEALAAPPPPVSPAPVGIGVEGIAGIIDPLAVHRGDLNYYGPNRNLQIYSARKRIAFKIAEAIFARIDAPVAAGGGQVPAKPEYRAGDLVHHAPSCETWTVAYTDPVTGRTEACGWPRTQVDTVELTLVRAATDDEHRNCLRAVIATDDLRGRTARRLYTDPPPPSPVSLGSGSQSDGEV